MKDNLYERMKKYAVQADSVEDFLLRYGKSKQYWERGDEYMQACIASHKEDIEKYGYTFMTHHDSKSGDTMAYYPSEQSRNDDFGLESSGFDDEYDDEI